MKILYINGYKGSNKKAKILEKMLNCKIDYICVDYDKDIAYQNIENKAKDYDLIIGSSTGSYLGRSICEKNNIPLISFNPVVDINDTFNKLKVPPPNLPKPDFLCLEELVLLNKDDELIDWQKTALKLNNQSNVVLHEKGGHRFENIEETKESILSFLKFLYIYS